jgi:hypothetical protein
MRKRYDRKHFMADPAKAVQRAAVDAAIRSAASVGKGVGAGLFKAGAFAFQQLSARRKQESTTHEPPLGRNDSDGEPSLPSAVAASLNGERPPVSLATSSSNTMHADEVTDREEVTLLTNASGDKDNTAATKEFSKKAKSKSKEPTARRGFAKRATNS